MRAEINQYMIYSVEKVIEWPRFVAKFVKKSLKLILCFYLFAAPVIFILLFDYSKASEKFSLVFASMGFSVISYTFERKYTLHNFITSVELEEFIHNQSMTFLQENLHTKHNPNVIFVSVQRIR